MKKLIYLVFVFAFLSCEKKGNEEIELTNESETPDFFDCDSEQMRMVRGMTTVEQAAWYHENQNKLCSEASFFNCVRSFHNISALEFYDYAVAHPQNSTGKIAYRKISAQKLDSILNTFEGACYDKYVTFDLGKQPNAVDFIKFKDFKEDSSRYSIPLLKGIINHIQQNGAGLNPEFEICSATIDNKNVVMFRVGSSGYYDYYNISHDPGK